MPKLSVFAFVGFVTLALCTAANAACPYTWHALTNGSPADATQVMDNFNFIRQCSGFTDWVGVQTNTPAALLDLTGSAASGPAFDALRFTETSGSANSRNWLLANGAFAYGDLSYLVSAASGGAPGGTPVWYLSKNGFVGTGTSSPSALLDLTGNAFNGNNYDAVRFNETSGSANSRNWMISNGAFAYGDISFLVSTASGGTPGGTPIFYLQKNGYVGTGTSTPHALFDLSGTSNTSAGAAGEALRFSETNTSTNARNWMISNGALVYGDLAFSVSQAQGGDPSPNGSAPTGITMLYLTKGGNVGIGTITPAQKLSVVGTIRQTGCTTAGTLSTNTSGDIICTSDARLKNISGPYTGGLASIMMLVPQRFTYKPTPNDPVETFVHAGFIAQNVKKVIPEAVATQKNGYYSLDTTAVLAAAVNAIKELKIANDQQSVEISQLKATVNALQQRTRTRTAMN